MSSLSTREYEKALTSLKEAFSAFMGEADESRKKLFRDATIQRFEFTVELAWKVSIKFLGRPATSPKPVIREMAQSGLITDIQAWFEAIEARNKTSHSYDEAVALEIIQKIATFIGKAEELLGKLKSK